MPEKEIDEINLKADKNNNNIPDWLEFATTYLIVGICIYIVLTHNISEGLIKWLLTTAAALAGGRDLIKGLVK